MIKRVCAAAFALLAGSTLAASAQDTCGGVYTVQRGDSLSLIADKLYKDVGQWTVIYRSNLSVIASPDSIRVGQQYRLPCIGGLPNGLPGGVPITEATATDPAASAILNEQVASVAEQSRLDGARAAQKRRNGDTVRLLAGDDFKPFTNRLQLSSGLISDIVNRAFVNADGIGNHKFYWVNDRSAHLDPMLSAGMADVAFPWKRPDCSGAASGSSLCEDYVYSDAMFEMLVVPFTKRGSGVTYAGEQDLAGLRVCSPLGHASEGRFATGAGYLAKAGARLQQPQRAEECFDRLMVGAADAVVMNEFTGRVMLKEMGLTDAVELQLGRPVAIEGLHAVAHRSNPQAEQIIDAFDAGLAVIRDNGEYLKVIDKHMSILWAGL